MHCASADGKSNILHAVRVIEIDNSFCNAGQSSAVIWLIHVQIMQHLSAENWTLEYKNSKLYYSKYMGTYNIV